MYSAVHEQVKRYTRVTRERSCESVCASTTRACEYTLATRALALCKCLLLRACVHRRFLRYAGLLASWVLSLSVYQLRFGFPYTSLEKGAGRSSACEHPLLLGEPWSLVGWTPSLTAWRLFVDCLLPILSCYLAAPNANSRTDTVQTERNYTRWSTCYICVREYSSARGLAFNAREYTMRITCKSRASHSRVTRVCRLTCLWTTLYS